MTYNSRRNRLDLMHPAEKAIHDSICEIEKLEANIELTNAQNLLSQAKDMVSNFLDSKPTVEPDAGKEQDAVAFAKWIASFEVEKEGIFFIDKIILVDGDWYWESDIDGDQPLTEEYLYTLYKQNK